VIENERSFSHESWSIYSYGVSKEKVYNFLSVPDVDQHSFNSFRILDLLANNI